MLVAVLPFVMEPLHVTMAVISWPSWPGFVTGTEFTVLDALALSLFFALPRVRQSLPFRISFALYLFATLLSALQASVPIPVIFYSWQLARMFLVYVVVVSARADPGALSALLKGMSAGLVLEAAVVLWQRFGLGLLQTPGTFLHQNTLGMVTHFIVFPFFALLLSGRVGWLPSIVVPAGIIVELLTTSRATLGLAAIGYSVVFVLSAMRGWTSRKAFALTVALAMCAAVAPVALSAIESRGSHALDGSDEERSAFISAASLMLSDHPLGVGADNFVVVADVEGYYKRVGVTWMSYLGTVHNVYWLVVAESGYFGLIAYVTFLLNPLIVAFWCSLRNRDDVSGDLLLGLGTALLIVYLHNFFEWVFITAEVQYMFTIDMGLVAGLAMRLGYWHQRRADIRRRVSASFATSRRASLS
jgi:O-antigen ligase